MQAIVGVRCWKDETQVAGREKAHQWSDCQVLVAPVRRTQSSRNSRVDASKNRDGPKLGLVRSRTAGVLEMEACSKGSLGYASRRGLGGWSVQPLPLCTSAHLLFLFQKRSNGAQCSLQISLVANSSLAGNGDLFQVGPNERDESVQGGLFKSKLQNRTTPFGETGGGTTMEFAAKPAVVCVDDVLVRSKQQLRGTCVEPQGDTHVARAPPAWSRPVVCSS